MTPLVSVIIPCYNQGSYLPFALRSVQAQTFTDWEVVLVNDGSTDGTAAVATQFSDVRVHYILQENQGLSAARNTGIRAAQGRYLTFLDSDDEWEPQFLERCVAVVTSDKSIVGAYTRSYFIDQDGRTLSDVGGEVVRPGAFRGRLLESCYFPANAVLVAASVVREVGLFDVTLTSEEDWDLWLRISERYTMRAIAQPLARYRIYTGSMSTNAARMHNNRLAVLTKYFGPPDGDPQAWSVDKRHAYAFAFRTTCIGYLQQGQSDEAWRSLAQSVTFWPDLLKRLDTLYELACGTSPWGQRSRIDARQLQDVGADLIRRLEQLLDQAGLSLQAVRRTTLGNAYWVLGMLADQNGDWSGAQSYLLKAWSTNRRLGLRYAFVRRLLKVSAGPRLVSALRKSQS